MKENHRIFCDEYLIDRNASRAYKAAYPNASDKTAGANGHNLLKKTEIIEYINERLEAVKSDRVADFKELVEFYTSMIRGEINDEVVLNNGMVVHARSKSSDRINAAKELAKMQGIDSKLARERFKLDKAKAEREAAITEAAGVLPDILKAVGLIE